MSTSRQTANYACGPERAMARVAEVPARAGREEGLAVGEERAAAELFFTLLMGPWYTRILFGLDRPEPEALVRRAELAVDCFLRLCRTEVAGPPAETR